MTTKDEVNDIIDTALDSAKIKGISDICGNGEITLSEKRRKEIVSLFSGTQKRDEK